MNLLFYSSEEDSEHFRVALGLAHLRVQTEKTLEEVIFSAKTQNFDATVLFGCAPSDITAMRRAHIILPIVAILSRKYLRDYELEIFAAGVDDVIRRPVDVQVLVARLQAIIRRCAGHAAPTVAFGDFVFDLSSLMLTHNGAPIGMTRKEGEMLELLVRRINTVVTKEMFLNHLYGGRDEPELKIIDVFLCRVRRILRSVSDQDWIETCWGRGYRLKEDASAKTIRNKRLPAAAQSDVHPGRDRPVA